MTQSHHLYLILFPNHALVASQLAPEDFAQHYQVGSNRHYRGKLIFASLNPSFRHEFFQIDWAIGELVPHPDGRPKATKFISSYRVLEHVPLSAFEKLYLATTEGFLLGLEKGKSLEKFEDGLQIYAEICPVNLLVLTRYNPEEFGRYIAHPKNPKGVPKLFFAQIDQDISEFLTRFEKNPFIHSPIPGLHPSKLRDAVQEFQDDPEKKTKGISLYFSLMQISFRLLGRGFWIVTEDESLHFSMPSLKKIEADNYRFFRSM